MSRWEAVVIGAILAGVAIVIGWFTHPVLTMSLTIILMALVIYVALWRQRNAGSAALVNRWTSHSKKHHGVASFWTILRTASWWAMKRKATILRPSLAKLSWWERWRTPVTEYATRLMKTGCLWVYSPCEDVTVRLGGARSGKTQELLCQIMDAPGAVIATSTKPELVTDTAWSRRRKGPLYVFNPSGLGGIPSTVAFPLLLGCDDPEVAIDRATDLLSPTGRVSGSDGDYWMTAARMALAALLRAAALLRDGTMWDVRSWVSDPERAAPQVMRLLSQPPGPLQPEALQFFTGGDKHRASVCAIISQALFWMNVPGAEEATRGGDFDVEKLLADKGTVYLLGAGNAALAPLVTAFTSHIAREGRRIAALQPGGRLDPPLTIAPDEAYRICTIPLDEWVADMGSHGMPLHISTQSHAQLRQRWGPDGANAILDNAASLIIFGGTRDMNTLSGYHGLIPALTQNLIAQLPAGHAVIIRRGMPPVVGKPPMAWRRHRSHQRRQFLLTPVTALTSALATYRSRRWVRRAATPRPVAALAVGHSAKAEWEARKETPTFRKG